MPSPTPRPCLLALLAAALSGSACYVVETSARELPPREVEAPPPRPHPRPPPPPATPPSGSFHVPPDRVPPRELCRIWYDDLPVDRQPAPMTCGRAHRVAKHHGGRVIWARSDRAFQDGVVASTDYGQVDLRGIPPDRLPPPGYCRVWLDGVPPDRQPEPAPCPAAEREAVRTGGRLVYMPSSDVR